MKSVVDWATQLGIGTVIVYAFSEENWKRTAEELGFMMKLIRFILEDQFAEAMKNNVRVKFIGNVKKFDTDIAEGMERLEKETKNNTGTTLVIAVSYGGRQEIITAVQGIVNSGVKDVSIENFEKYLYTSDIPDPDMIIRTSGEIRLSGFLPWQGVYSELFFTETFWPDFSQEEFTAMVRDFGLRQRRLGK
jgi:undecaprenyl diphosphate synthase